MVPGTSLPEPYLGKCFRMWESPSLREEGASRGPLLSLLSNPPWALSPRAGPGGGGGRQPVPRAPSSSSRSPLQGLDQARGLGAPTPRGAPCPARARPQGPRAGPRTHRSPPRCLSWRSPRSPCLGRRKEGVREGNGGWGRPTAPTGGAAPTSRVRAVGAPGAEAPSSRRDGWAGSERRASANSSARAAAAVAALAPRRPRADTPPSPPRPPRAPPGSARRRPVPAPPRGRAGAEVTCGPGRGGPPEGLRPAEVAPGGRDWRARARGAGCCRRGWWPEAHPRETGRRGARSAAWEAERGPGLLCAPRRGASSRSPCRREPRLRERRRRGTSLGPGHRSAPAAEPAASLFAPRPQVPAEPPPRGL